MRLRPDDEVYRVDAVWLGPQGWTLPWTARYTAYAVWLSLFVAVLAVEAVTPLRVGVPPVWEFVFTVLGTYALMGLVDHERPVHTLWQLLRVEVSAPRPVATVQRLRVDGSRVRVRRPADAPPG